MRKRLTAPFVMPDCSGPEIADYIIQLTREKAIEVIEGLILGPMIKEYGKKQCFELFVLAMKPEFSFKHYETTDHVVTCVGDCDEPVAPSVPKEKPDIKRTEEMDALYSKILERRAAYKKRATQIRQKGQVNSLGLALLRKYSQKPPSPPAPKAPESPKPLRFKEPTEEDLEFDKKAVGYKFNLEVNRIHKEKRAAIRAAFNKGRRGSKVLL